jgi:hypothetical protein
VAAAAVVDEAAEAEAVVDAAAGAVAAAEHLPGRGRFT